jgi:Ser/Thr protein kinase RdoA (MazF antagonist)
VTPVGHILELVGPPGAGKSTAAPVVMQRLRDRGFHPMTVDGAIEAALDRSLRGRAVRFAGIRRPYRRRVRALLVDVPGIASLPLVAPRLIGVLAGALVALPVSGGHRTAIALRVLRVVAAHRYLRSRLRPGEVVVADEGPVHRVVNLYAWRHATPEASIRRYLESAPLGDAVLELEASSAVATGRLRSRAGGLPERLRGTDDVRLRRFVDSAAAALTVARHHLEPRVRWVTVATERLSATAIAESLEALGFADPLGPSPACRSTPPYRPRGGMTVRRPGRAGAARPRRVDAATVPADVRDAWQLDTRLVLGLGAGGRSASLLVETAAGKRVVVKRYKQSMGTEAIRTEHDVLTSLAQHSFPAPRLVPSLDGSTLVCDEGGGRFAAFEYLDGYVPMHTRLSLPGDRPRAAFDGGQALGALHRTLADMATPYRPDTGFGSLSGPRVRGLDWHLERLVAHQPPRQADPVAKALPWVRERLAALDATLSEASPTRGLIHGDYGPYNLLVRLGAPIVVIDFELARLDWHLTDLATAIPRFAANRLRFSASAARAFVDGYRLCHPLSDDELQWLPDVASFLALRRVAVAWGRYVESGTDEWLAEAGEKLGLARTIANRRHGLVHLADGVW